VLNTRLVYGRNVGTSRATTFNPQKMKEQIALAKKGAKHTEDPDFVSLPPKQKGYTELKNFGRRTDTFTPEERGEWVERMVRLAKEHNLKTAGYLTTSTSLLSVVNSLGLEASTQLTEAELSVTAIGESSTGYAEARSFDVGEIDAIQTAQRAVEKALKSQNPVGIEPGKYTVVLEPLAASDLISYLSFLAFGALAFHENRSYFSQKLGEKVASPLVTIYDDVYDSRTIGMPFDFEGAAKKKVTFITDGIAEAVAYDSYTASKHGKVNTGHALLPPNPYGPYPMNLIMKAGDIQKDGLIRSCKKGLLITRFWYIRVISPKETLVTGTTRDGTFLIEDGKITKPVKNLRFQERIVDALSRVEAVSKETESYSVVAPWLKIRDFNFIGGTEY
jgi:predicted Zn-dependent protease